MRRQAAEQKRALLRKGSNVEQGLGEKSASLHVPEIDLSNMQKSSQGSQHNLGPQSDQNHNNSLPF